MEPYLAAQTFGSCRNAKPKQKAPASAVRMLLLKESAAVIFTVAAAPEQKHRKENVGQNTLGFNMAIIRHK